MFATGPANNCAVETFTSDGYCQLTTFKGMENIRTLEMMLDVEIEAAASASNQIIMGEAGSFFIDMDCNGAVANPLSGLRGGITRGSQKNPTPSDTTPDFGKRLTLWLKDDQATASCRLNGASGTSVTYTTTEAATQIVTPVAPFYIGRGTNTIYRIRLYEAAIMVNGNLVFHVRPRLYMADSATPGTIPDLSPYGNNLTMGGTHLTDYRYIPSWSRQVPYSGRETVG